MSSSTICTYAHRWMTILLTLILMNSGIPLCHIHDLSLGGTRITLICSTIQNKNNYDRNENKVKSSCSASFPCFSCHCTFFRICSSFNTWICVPELVSGNAHRECKTSLPKSDAASLDWYRREYFWQPFQGRYDAIYQIELSRYSPFP